MPIFYYIQRWNFYTWDKVKLDLWTVEYQKELQIGKGKLLSDFTMTETFRHLTHFVPLNSRIFSLGRRLDKSSLGDLNSPPKRKQSKQMSQHYQPVQTLSIKYTFVASFQRILEFSILNYKYTSKRNTAPWNNNLRRKKNFWKLNTWQYKWKPNRRVWNKNYRRPLFWTKCSTGPQSRHLTKNQNSVSH